MAITNAPGGSCAYSYRHDVSLNPDLGGEVMVIGLGCEKLRPERLLVGTDDVQAIPVQKRQAFVSLQMKTMSVFRPW
ncbi:hypothetical protein ACLB1T_07535 [Escherichia coli]